jgi:hypothetical protein
MIWCTDMEQIEFVLDASTQTTMESFYHVI